MSLDAYPRIADWVTERDGRLVLHTGKVDIGQRISTALTQIAHEELTVPLDRIDIAPVRTGHAPDEGITSGSNSVEQSGHALRCACASLRTHLMALAARQYGGDVQDWDITDGILHLPGTNHRIDLVTLMPDLDPEAKVDPACKFLDRTAVTLPGPAMRGLADMLNGRFVFVHDLERPGMVHARVIRPPHARARLMDVPAETVRQLQASGFSIIRDGSFLAVAGAREWPVVKAAARLGRACVWEAAEGLDETDPFEQLAPENAQRFAILDATPCDAPIPEALDNPDYVARFERPYQMHAALAPSAALAEWSGERLTLHSHSQGIYALRDSIADSLGLNLEQVDITHVPGSGCYGHNGADDAAFEAALIALSLPKTPILLKWSREDEHAWEPYAPAMAVNLAATVSDGKVTAFSADVFSDTHRGRPRAGPNRAGPARLLANHFRETPIGPIPAQPNMGRHAGMHRNLDPVYSFATTRLVKNLVQGMPLRTSALRCLGATANIFAIESFMDEIAVQNGIPPIAFRRSHLQDPRAVAVLEELDRQVRCRPDMAEGFGRGIAYGQYKNQMTRVGLMVELGVNDRAEVQLLKAIIVADAGRIVDADGLSAQLEGGFLQAASWALYEEVTWDRDGIESRDWDSYPVIRFDNVPKIDVVLLDHPDAPSVGAGEASPGPTVAAIANAIADAIGVRMRRMPFTPERIMQTAAM